jgi:hypothetical protein
MNKRNIKLMDVLNDIYNLEYVNRGIECQHSPNQRISSNVDIHRYYNNKQQQIIGDIIAIMNHLKDLNIK